jgi:GTPase SAR1 family protein
MPEVETSPLASTPVSSEAGRIVLFGMPNAGKSSLLGALLQAAQTQEQILNGRLTDLSQGLAELQRRLYEDHPRGTPEEIVSYPIRFEPFPARGPGPAPASFDAVLIDCSGLVANELLARQRSLDQQSPDGSLAQSILEADTLLLVIDASANPAQIEADFTQFARFLGLLERSRGRRTAISGLPVFLVLTKCDLLARPTDSPGTWLMQIEDRKRQVAERFHHFRLRDQPNTTPFGRINLHVWATAVKRPVLEGTPEKPREPYGVAELFRQGFDCTHAFLRQQRRSGRRLALTSAAVIGVLLLLAGAAALLALSRGGREPTELQTQVDHFRGRQQALSPATAHRDLAARIDELTGFTRDPAFAQLPENRRAYVEEQLQELKAYQAYEKQLADITDPRDATSLSQLDQIETRLKQLTLPTEYRSDWSQTDAGRRQTEWLADIAALRAAVLKVDAWYRKLIQDGQVVLDNLNGPNLPERAHKVLEEANAPPFPLQDQDKLVPGSRRVPYAAVMGFSSVTEHRRQWESLRKRLEPFSREPRASRGTALGEVRS